MNEYIYTAAIYIAAGFLQGVTGFGHALIAMPLMTLYLDMPVAVPLTVLCGVLINGKMGWEFRRFADKQRLRPLFIGAVPGIIFGVIVLHNVPSGKLKVFMGAFLVTYALYGLLLEKRYRVALSSGWGYVAGFLTGAIGAAFSTGGPPTVVYTALTGWPKEVVKATLACFFFVLCIAISVTHAVSGLMTMHVLGLIAVTAPALFAGTQVGIRFSGRIPERVYRKILFTLLLFMGCMMGGFFTFFV